MREDWIECTLGEVCFTTSGGTPSRQNKAFYNGTIPWVKSGELDKGVIYDSEEHISEEAIKKSSAKIFPKGTLLFALYGATIGKMATLGVDAATNQAICGIYKSSVFNSDFLYHYLFFRKNFLIQQGIGGAQPNISQTILKKLNIPVSPLVEQKAIVKKIEELFSSLDSGIADLKKAQDQLVVYRQAVLSSSFPKKKKIEISELVENLSQGWSPKCINQASTDSSQWAVIKTSAIQSGRFVEFENKILPDNLEPREQHEIKKGDILITRAGPRVRVGICCLVRKTRPKLINCDKVYRLELNKKLIDGEYFEYALNSPEILSKIEVMKSGSSDSGLNLTQKVFLKLEIPYVNKKQQLQIVREIESRLSVCDKVEESIKESLQKAQALRQSILKKAFEGKLLSAAEIAKCKADKEYEPASVLLEKIKAKKA
ncbi:restriction endonuclease subunit S [Kordia sp. YSTF-M3]|uniref:Restriction endonuclease subunit S n=1 Tax=Kordia aestuariivivens TaxID=2759037 RepID=A0ABR7Q4U5_9FLAO|nr:restriction endonuclease subunit S [Kordia aestuariivivens]MBC8753570.1 restriction endonuclease subunit S [Kordia aestuariivivens]